jgi:hypothetical protein
MITRVRGARGHRRTTATLAFVSISILLVSDPVPGRDTDGHVDIGLRRQLLVDDFIIDRKTKVTRRLGAVTKKGIVLKPSLETDFHPSWKKPDGSRVALDFGYYVTVLRNDKRNVFQMWYMAWRHAGVGYAESDDGIHWKQALVSKGGTSNIVHHSQGFSCTIDPTLPWGHPEKYKGAADLGVDGYGGPRSCVGLCYSSDGIHWRDYNEGKPVSHRAADTHNQIFWDPLSKKHRLLTRTDLGAGGGAAEWRSSRVMEHASSDILKSPTAWKTLTDRIVVDDPQKEQNRAGHPRLQFNGMTCWVHEGIYFVLMDVYTMDESGFFDGFDYETRHERDYMDFYLGTSRDGIHIDKSWIHTRRPFVPRGGKGAFDKDGIKPPSRILTVGDEHRIYYGGMSERHYSRGRHLNIGLATLPRDRFIGQAAGPGAGTILTKPFRLEGGELRLNVAAPKGHVSVALLSESGEVLEGFAAEGSARARAVDELAWSPRWSRPLRSLRGQTVRLRLELRNAVVYALQFASADKARG